MAPTLLFNFRKRHLRSQSTVYCRDTQWFGKADLWQEVKEFPENDRRFSGMPEWMHLR